MKKYSKLKKKSIYKQLKYSLKTQESLNYSKKMISFWKTWWKYGINIREWKPSYKIQKRKTRGLRCSSALPTQLPWRSKWVHPRAARVIELARARIERRNHLSSLPLLWSRPTKDYLIEAKRDPWKQYWRHHLRGMKLRSTSQSKPRIAPPIMPLTPRSSANWALPKRQQRTPL